MDIPPEFWKGLTDKEFASICETSALNRRLCKRLYRMMGRTDPPPDKMLVLLNREDVMRLFPPKEKQH